MRYVGRVANPSWWVALCCLARAFAAAQWSIVVPRESLLQLSKWHVQPSKLSGDLFRLLHASNVLNNHLVNVTSAGGGPNGTPGVAAGLLAMQQSSGAQLSGGYAGMPQDLPVRYVRGVIVSPDDPRELLQNEFTLTATQVSLLNANWAGGGVCQCDCDGVFQVACLVV